MIDLTKRSTGKYYYLFPSLHIHANNNRALHLELCQIPKDCLHSANDVFMHSQMLSPTATSKKNSKVQPCKKCPKQLKNQLPAFTQT